MGCSAAAVAGTTMAQEQGVNQEQEQDTEYGKEQVYSQEQPQVLGVDQSLDHYQNNRLPPIWVKVQLLDLSSTKNTTFTILENKSTPSIAFSYFFMCYKKIIIALFFILGSNK